MSEDKHTWTFEAGLLVRGSIRGLLGEIRFRHHPDLEWLETKGWLESRFVVRGSLQAIRLLKASIANIDRE